jgi:uncharacterized membrane protein HdeD (DUF308 family)
MLSVLARNWWAFVIRGVLAVLFGLIALFLPGVTMLSLVIVFAAYAVTDGVFAIVAAVRAAKAGERWMLFVLEGIVDIVAGIVAVAWPALTVVVFVALIAAWALVTGALTLVAASRVDDGRARVWLIAASIVSILYGVLLVAAPLAGAVVLTWWIGAYALVFGIAMLVFAFRLRAKFKAGPLGSLV